MTTPTTMTTSMITTATTMMTNVVVAPSLEGLLVGCMLLNGTVPVVPTVWGGEVVPTVWGGEVVPTVWGGEVVSTVWGGEVVPTVWGGEVVPPVWGREVAPTVWGGEVVPTVWGGEVVGGGVTSVGLDAAERKYITWRSSTIYIAPLVNGCLKSLDWNMEYNSRIENGMERLMYTLYS